MSEKMGDKGFEDVLTPLNQGPHGKEKGFPVYNIPELHPPDPLGIIPGGNKRGSKKNKSGIGDKVKHT